MPQIRRSVLAVSLVLGLAGVAGLEAQCALLKSPGPTLAESIGLVYGEGVDARLVGRAVEHWQACGNYRQDFPSFINGGIGTRTIRIERGGSSRTNRCGFFAGSRIVLYRSAVGEDGKPAVCGDLAQNLAHELGHVLGLLDIEPDLTCKQHIMAPITPSNTHARSVTEAECRAVGRRWWTLSEQREQREMVVEPREAAAGL